MLISRLIADQNPDGTGDLETMLKPVSYALAHSDSVPHYESAEIFDWDVPVLEMRWGCDDVRLIQNIIDVHFPSSDSLVTSAEPRVPRLFVSDMDSTMIGQECIDELADFAGLKEQISDITERAMQGELDFESALKERVALLKGLEEGAIERCLRDRISPTPGAKTLCQTLKAFGCRNVLVTGGFHHFGDEVGAMLGFDRVVGNRLGVADGRLTGGLDGPITDANTKKAVLIEEAARFGEDATTLASGDGANDIPMIEVATYGFAYRAKPKARAASNGRIDRGDLTSILSLLGIPRDDWTTG